ncbi:MAG: aspartate kinase [Nitrososphaeraceae archaeon]
MKIIVAKFGGSTIGENGKQIPMVINRIKNMKNDKNKIIAVFSAPLTKYDGKVRSMTDIAINIGKKYSNSKKLDTSIFEDTYRNIANQYVSKKYLKDFDTSFAKFNNYVTTSLNNAFENKRFIDVTRSKTLAYSGEITMSYLMDYIMKSNGIKSDHIEIEKWPIITDDNFEAANFLIDESKRSRDHLLELIMNNDVVSIGGFIGKTVDGLETTYERGGSDRTAADIAIILNDLYETEIDFEKDNVVLSADPKIVKNDLEYVKLLSYNEAKLAGMFGMKILDPIAIKELDDNNCNIPIIITSIHQPSNFTTIKKMIDTEKNEDNMLIKIITGKRNCAIVRMETISSSHLEASLEKDKLYHNFLKLSPYKTDDIEMTRLLFLDAEYVKRNVKHFRAYYPKTEFVYNRGVVTLIGDKMSKVPKIVSTAGRTVGENDINILDFDAQEETSRILIIVEDKDDNVANTVKVIHEQRNKIIRKN